MKYTTVIFDMDGTILNTIEDITDSVNATLEAFGYEKRTIDEVKHFVGNGASRLIEKALPGGKENPDFNKILDYYEDYYLNHCNIKTRPYDHILDLMAVLKKKGCKLAVVSNKPMDAVLELNERYFKEYISCAIGVTADLKRKPAPDECLLAMKELGSSPDECIYVGDSEVDYMTSVNTGIPCISCLWGFRTKEELMAAGAGENIFVTDPMQIAELECFNS